MATINFLYRSIKPKAPLNLRLLFRRENKDYVLGGKTKLEVSRNYWENFHQKQRIKDVDIKNKQISLNGEMSQLENYILKHFASLPVSNIDKDWLKTTIENYYNPKSSTSQIPADLVNYIDFYLDYRKNEISESNVKKVKITKNKMNRLQTELGRTILVEDVNEDFKKAYVDFCIKKRYSQNTQQRELVLIKTICFHARYHGLKTHHQLDSLKLQRQEALHIYLNLSEIETIKNLRLDNEYLSNARDWLLMSCYTGQRVSDFMRFKSTMIRVEEGKHLLEFRQQKTKKLMTIPLIKEAREVLEKRNGNFPRPISDQRYNDYIKEVCKLAGLKERVKGKKRECIAPIGIKPTKNDYRDVLGTYEKWELVSSHIGRRSFATNHYGKVPTTYLINITGHGSEKMFLNYIKKSNKDLAMDAYNYFT